MIVNNYNHVYGQKMYGKLSDAITYTCQLPVT